jgi:hypothetical protein
MLWRRQYPRDWLPTLQNELDRLATMLYAFDGALRQVRKIHVVCAPYQMGKNQLNNL